MINLFKKLLLNKDNSKKFDARVWIQLALLNKNLKFLIIDCLWYNFHPSHFNLENSLNVIKMFKPKQAILTNLSPVLDYKVLKKLLPKNVIPAHDGLTLEL